MLRPGPGPMIALQIQSQYQDEGAICRLSQSVADCAATVQAARLEMEQRSRRRPWFLRWLSSSGRDWRR